MDKTLYVVEKRGLEVTRDGPSIWISEDGKAGRRIPVRLVSHVVIIGNVRMDAASITLFTDNNIPVTFMNRRGSEIAVTIPHNHNLNSHSEEQKYILARDESIEQYKQWLLTERRRVQLKVIKKLSGSAAAVFTSNGFREQDYHDFIAQCAPAGVKRWKPVNMVISAMLSEMIMKSILAADLDPHLGVFHRRDNFGLVLDIFYALEPEADLQTIRFFKSDKTGELLNMTSTGLKLSREGMREVALRFENRKKLISGLIETVIDNLFETMRSIRFFPYNDRSSLRQWCKS